MTETTPLLKTRVTLSYNGRAYATDTECRRASDVELDSVALVLGMTALYYLVIDASCLSLFAYLTIDDKGYGSFVSSVMYIVTFTAAYADCGVILRTARTFHNHRENDADVYIYQAISLIVTRVFTGTVTAMLYFGCKTVSDQVTLSMLALLATSVVIVAIPVCYVVYTKLLNRCTHTDGDIIDVKLYSTESRSHATGMV